MGTSLCSFTHHTDSVCRMGKAWRKRRDFYEDMYDDRRYWGNDDYWNDDDDDDVSGEFDRNPWL